MNDIQTKLANTEDMHEVDPALQKLGDLYAAALLKKSKSTETYNTRKTNLIEGMLERGETKVWVQGDTGTVVFELNTKHSVKKKQAEERKEEETDA
jgi:hypothetical protein